MKYLNITRALVFSFAAATLFSACANTNHVGQSLASMSSSTRLIAAW